MTDRDETPREARRKPAETAPGEMRAPDGSLTAAHRAALDAYAREIEREGLALSRHRSF